MRRRRHASQDVDVEHSFSVQDEGAEEGYHIGLVGAILKYFMTLLAGLLLVATQTETGATFFVLMLVVFYVAGWIMTREAGMRTLASYDTVLDVLAYGATFGFLIRVVEAVVLRLTAGLEQMDLLSPFEPLMNSSLTVGGIVMTAVGLVFAAVAEEMLHRGGMIYLANVLSDRRGMGVEVAKFIALIVQAATFALLHSAVYQKPEQMLALFAGGIV
ncbi:MAG: CPBP family glutamic-type intramembrane protease, partial [Candidatus Thorarchaeota archaeon]